MAKYYAVRNGYHTGIFNTWDECKKEVSGFSGAEYTEATTSPQKNMRAELLFSMRGKKRHSAENFQIPKTPQ